MKPMTVTALINQMLALCEQQDVSPDKVEVMKVIPQSGPFGDDWGTVRVDTAGGNEYPFVILLN